MMRSLLASSRVSLAVKRIVLPALLESPSQSLLLSPLRSFSAEATRKIPGNVTIDPLSSFAPTPPTPRRIVSPTALDATQEDEDDDAFFAAEEENDEEEFELTVPDVLYAKPLPDRLQVEIQTIFAPAHDATVGTLWLDANVFGRNPVRVDLLKRAVLYYRNKLRGRRKAHSKTISEVSGSGRKLRAQKGQGMARVGHSRPAHHRGGAKAHGPKNLTDYGNTKLNKKVRKQALCHALTQKLLEGNLIVLDHLYGLTSYKTRELARLLDAWAMGGKVAGKSGAASALILDSYYPSTADKASQSEAFDSVASHRGVPVPFYLAAANVPRITVGNDHAASVYQILRHDKLVLTLAALGRLEERLKNV